MALIFSACGSDDSTTETGNGNETGETSDLKDGVYYQVEEEVAKNGYQQYLTFEVKDGKIISVDYDSYNMKDGDSRVKSVRAEEGDYNLAEGSVAPINEQYVLIEKFIMNDDITAVTFEEEKSDAISGATIKYESAKTLYEAAIKAGPIASKGSMEDGYYFGEAVADGKGNTSQATYVVFNGNIVSAWFDAQVPSEEDDSVSYKSTLSMEEKYNLAEGAVASMHEQLAAASADFVKNQGVTYELNEEGKTDAVSGATISLAGYVEAVEKAEKK